MDAIGVVTHPVIMYIRYTYVINRRFLAFTANLSENGRKLDPVLALNRER